MPNQILVDQAVREMQMDAINLYHQRLFFAACAIGPTGMVVSLREKYAGLLALRRALYLCCYPPSVPA